MSDNNITNIKSDQLEDTNIDNSEESNTGNTGNSIPKEIRFALDPIFAPVTYGDDRQVTRTRRGIICAIENNLNPNLVYCRCKNCNYEWIMDKQKYISGTAKTENVPNPTVIKNVGTGGTGIWICNLSSPIYSSGGTGRSLHYKDGNIPAGISIYSDYDKVTGRYMAKSNSQYLHLAHDTSYCKEIHKKCENGLMYTHDFHPLTGGTGGDGILLDTVKDLWYDEETGALTGDIDSHYLGNIIPVYTECSEDIIKSYHVGGSGTYGGGTEVDENGTVHSAPAPRKFGGYPMACPNCCKVNFLAKWLEPEDRPYPYGEYEHKKPEDIPAKSSQHPDELEQQNPNSYIIWAYQNIFLKQFNFSSTTWFVQDSIFKQHVCIMVFDGAGMYYKDSDLGKIGIRIFIDHISGTFRINWDRSVMTGYIWVLSPDTYLSGYIGNIDKVCTGIIVRDFQKIKFDAMTAEG